jgi:hypothetical protein
VGGRTRFRVGLTGAIRVSFDTSYGKECLTWLIGLAVYITLRADKDNTPPFGALGLRKTATLRAPSLNAEKKTIRATPAIAHCNRFCTLRAVRSRMKFTNFFLSGLPTTILSLLTGPPIGPKSFVGSSPIGCDPLLSSAISRRPAASRPASAYRTSEVLFDGGVTPVDSGVVQGEVPHGATLHGEANSDEALPRVDAVESLASRLRRSRW